MIMLQMLLSIRSWFESLDQKTFRNYALGAGGGLLVLSIGIMYYNYRSVSTLIQALDDVNSERKKVKTILIDAKQVQKKQETVRKMLDENLSFKINQYLTQVLETLHLSNKSEPLTSGTRDIDDKHRETSVTVILNGMSMKEVTQLLQELEKKEKIYIKELSIERDKKRAETVKVIISIGTLEPKR